MGDLQPVRSAPSPLGRASKLVGALVVVGLALAIVKPWGSDQGGVADAGPSATASSDAGPSATASSLASSAATPVLDPAGFGNLRYDPAVFGGHEPPAEWALWPTSFLVTFGFVMQLPDATAGPSPASSGPPADGGPRWPSRFEVPEGDHLFLIGIDMPLGTALVSATLTAGVVDLPLANFTSPWPDHFAVIGIATEAGHLQVWAPGEYRLALHFSPGGINRSIAIAIPRLPGQR